MTLSLTRSSKIESQTTCAPCCHYNKTKYHGIAAVITPSYPDGVDYTFFTYGWNRESQANYITFNYTSDGFTLFLTAEAGNTKTFKTSNQGIEIANNNPDNNSEFLIFTSKTQIQYYVKLVVVDNISMDVYFSTDDITYIRQNETFYGEYLSFVVEFENLSASPNPIKMRITINTGVNNTNIYQSVNPTQNDYYATFSESENYDGTYRNYVPLNENNLPINGQNVVTMGESFIYGKQQLASYTDATTNKKIGLNQQADNARGYYYFQEILSGTWLNGGYIIYPVYNWFPMPDVESYFYNYFNDLWIRKNSWPPLSRQVSALVDYRLPVHYVAKPYYFKSTVVFAELFVYPLPPPFSPPPPGQYFPAEILSTSKVVITE